MDMNADTAVVDNDDAAAGGIGEGTRTVGADSTNAVLVHGGMDAPEDATEGAVGNEVSDDGERTSVVAVALSVVPEDADGEDEDGNDDGPQIAHEVVEAEADGGADTTAVAARDKTATGSGGDFHE